MENLLISACLLGAPCKYTGGSNRLSEELLDRLRAEYHLIPVCPETAGGLPVPREPSERRGDRVVSISGRDVTAEYRKGAETALRLAERFGCEAALLKERSPSCGTAGIYDGSFSGNLTEGTGTAAEKLSGAGVLLFGEGQADKLLERR